MSKIMITEKQAKQFNLMLHQLRKIHKDYKTSQQIRRCCESQYGLGYEESLEMAYENLQSEARAGCSRVKPIQINAQPKTPQL